MNKTFPRSVVIEAIGGIEYWFSEDLSAIARHLPHQAEISREDLTFACEEASCEELTEEIWCKCYR